MEFSMSKLLMITCISTISAQQYSTYGGVTVDNALNRLMLNKHNDLRGNLARNGLPDTSYNSQNLQQPTATYMNELFYDPSLAALAQNYLNTVALPGCTYPGHNNNRQTQFASTYGQYAAFKYDTSATSVSIGENLLSNARNETGWATSQEQNAAKAKQQWWDEYKWYEYDTQTCYPPTAQDSCGHYTQMAWADTRYVGCGSIECEATTPTGHTYDRIITLCNYYPVGNVNNKAPYTDGTPCSECATKAPDRDQCIYPSGTSGLCSGCQSPWMGRCTDAASNCASFLYQYCPSESECEDIGLDGDGNGVLNGHLCAACADSCGTCNATQLAATSCSNDGLSYGFTDFSAAFTSEDPVVITERANWAIAGMCMIFGACCIVLGIGYFLHQRKVDQLKIKLKSAKLINNDSKQQDIAIDDGHVTAPSTDVSIDVDENGQRIEIEASIEKTNE